MNLLKLKNIAFLSASLFFTIQYGLAQEGSLEVNQDPKIDRLLAIKTDMNKSETDSDRYKIQIYSGNGLDAAEKAKSKVRLKLNDLPATIEFETPNYKVWVGNFRSKLEADRALLKVQKEFRNAFVFKPKKIKE